MNTRHTFLLALSLLGAACKGKEGAKCENGDQCADGLLCVPEKGDVKRDAECMTLAAAKDACAKSEGCASAGTCVFDRRAVIACVSSEESCKNSTGCKGKGNCSVVGQLCGH